MERDPTKGARVKIPSQATLERLADPEGYDLDGQTMIRALDYTHWRGHPVVEILRGRTFRRPVRIKHRDLRRLRHFAAFPFQTPAEILFYWRNSRTVFNHPPLFRVPPDIAGMARFLGVAPGTYKDLENGRNLPTEKMVEKIAAKLGLSRQEKQRLTEAIERMRGWLAKNDAHPRNNPTQNRRGGKARRA